MQIGEKRIKYLSEKDPSKLPWKELGIDVVVEATDSSQVRKRRGRILMRERSALSLQLLLKTRLRTGRWRRS